MADGQQTSGISRRRGHGSGHGRVRASGLVAVVGVLLLLASCGTVPGAGVVIDGTETSTQTVRDRVADVLGAEANADPDAWAHEARAQVTSVIRHQLARLTAKSKGIVVSEADVNEFIANYDTYQKSSGSPSMGSVLGVPESDLRATVYDLQVFDKLITAIPKAGAEVTDVEVTVDAVPAATWADAIALRTKYLADPAEMDAAAKAALAANPQLPGGQESLLKQPQHAVFGIFSAAAGEILTVSQGTAGYLVVRITSRTERPGKLTGPMISEAYQAAGLGAEIALASLLLGPAAESAKVDVNPRFGIWDPRIVQVVAGD